MKKIIIILGLLQLSTSCDTKNDTRLMIVNKANHSIVVMASYNYPDTIDYTISECRSNNEAYIYKPNDSKFYPLIGQPWDSYLDRINSKTLMLFIYNADTAKYYYDKTGNCNELKDKELRRVDVTINYLNNNNFTITYP